MKFILIFALIPVLILTVLVSGLVSSVNSKTLNSSLAESGLYEKLPQILVGQLSKLYGEADAKTLATISSKLRDDPTFGYLRSMIEKFDNDLFDYLDGKTGALPVITLPDKTPRDSLWGIVVQPTLKNFGVSKKFELPANVTSNIEAVKNGYEWFKLSPLILAALVLVLTVILILFGRDWPHRARLVGKAFLFASIFGLAIFTGLTVLLPKLPGLQIPNFPQQFQFAQEPLLSLVTAFLVHVNSNLGTLYGSLLIIGVVLFAGSRFLSKKESEL
ncbi:MAG: hypothetical protein HZB99_03585 [Candidatus Harrisonbacteria bacterium]|nr:hypothetical protein [Candidatus Harrisonbacteria bacterium]